MERKSMEDTQAWHRARPWQMGYNFVPTYAVNDVEFWMNDTFDIDTIRKELRVGAGIGFTSVRVFLPYIVWQHEGEVFERHFDEFLQAAADVAMSVVPVLFDDCAFDVSADTGAADPVWGRQPDVCADRRNLGRWVPSPGFAVQDDPDALEACGAYVKALVGGHRDDDRILLWDLYNEPGNTGRFNQCLPLLTRAFAWARECDPSQPLTVGPWLDIPELDEVARVCLEQSDIISFHSYLTVDGIRAQLDRYAQDGRPVIVTEWFNRISSSLPETVLPLLYERNVWCWQWGLIGGRGHDNYSSLDKPDGTMLWQHDLLDSEGHIYDEAQLRLIRSYAVSGKH